MSEATKAICLQEATKLCIAAQIGDGKKVVEIAKLYDAFFADSAPAAVAVVTPAADPKPEKVTKTDAKPPVAKADPKPGSPERPQPKAAPKKAEPKPEPETTGEDAAAAKLLEQDDAPEVTKEQVSSAVAKLISAQLRDQAVELLKKHGANSISALPAEAYAEVLAEAQQLLALA